MLLSLLLAAVAGMVTIINPCVLPLLPIILASALDQHRLGPFALVAGLSVSFSTIGFLVVAFGYRIGLDEQVLRTAGGVMLLLAGAVFMVPRWQSAISSVGGMAVAPAQKALSGASGQGLTGQFLVGGLLGLVWTPCVGPTLGAAIAAASQGKDLGYAFATFASFSAGIGLVLLGLAYGSKHMLQTQMRNLRGAAPQMRKIFGMIMALIGAAVVLGLDKSLEAAILALMPDALVAFSSRF